ncbi:glycosyl hydrolase family 95 catalytic domain-containing protein [Galbibacter sp.]|uniref:glycoside hydrolase family 95 protein n=1 Tax=Galbibacter sp. TaxID=2918471 RepID=UPI003A942C91
MVRHISLALLALGIIGCNQQHIEATTAAVDELWYEQAAEDWMQALPIGNGRLGAMVFGNPDVEHLQLNEDSMWPGGPTTIGDSKGTAEDLAQLRALIDQGKVHQADKFIVEKFSHLEVTRSHQTAGDLFIDFKRDGVISDYYRGLDFDNAMATVSYKVDGAQFTEKIIASQPDDALIIQLETTAEKGLDFDIKLSRPLDQGTPTVSVEALHNDQLIMNGMVTQLGGKVENKAVPMKQGVKFQTRLKAIAQDGTVQAADGFLELRGVKKAVIYLVTKTSFYHDDYQSKAEENLNSVASKDFEELLDGHSTDFRKFYDRVQFSLGDAALDSLPTDKRLQRYKDGQVDLDLQTKLFDYGRYLLISSSRPGTNPANLQGIWNNHIAAPWNADYHLNINLQMNYWPSMVANLSELQQPLFDFADRLLLRGKKTAEQQYGIHKGAVMHQTTDLWAPAVMFASQPYWGSWIHGGGWLAQHYWEQYRFTQDVEFLEQRAYPFMKEIALFYMDWLQMNPETQQWVSYPETSPENSYFAADGKPAAVSKGNAMGHQIIAEVFDNVISAAQVLNIEDDFVAEVKNKRSHLTPGVVIGDDGRILEWDKPYEEPEKGHRHLSHLYALHPGDAITPATPEAFKAAKKTIDYRLDHGGAGTGWSRAWMISFNARLFDNVSAEENINKFFEISIADNLFDEHPPFQIDGNFGYTAGVIELLLQSHEGFLRILPSLPQNWTTGSITGIKARGDIEVDLDWDQNQLTQLTLESEVTKIIEVTYADINKELSLEAGKPLVLDASLNPITNN